ncbi:mediator of retention of lumenal endoplasmic reticulum proteins, putative [Candida dubliniensis CD36]|uniref:Mediator of retention of lumenal endoplasmic reticulum proteins, putative n=1 Tax=Candida dubliniensis (strain CD36 / ATCC MYA-646 / CBS 7987 / NCPF 3949 / NRRL Y-17841) TaxID=573826 RepID=B9W8H6_CANDC|nr:mediator of retention of lumenal endoplasmic reticulum proteins, putative [Candida dubliniensis CD36]CAX45047.1 mediator of retention of lumenal endoplasmic reticulum proteins, putative [Candida dubliniensis CD36]
MGEETPNQTHEILFNDFIPLSFRVTFSIHFGLILWLILNLLLTNFTTINVLQLLKLSYTPHNYTHLDDRSHNHETTNNQNNESLGEYAAFLPSDSHENDRLIKGIWSSLKFVSIINIICWIIYKSIANIPWLAPLFYALPLISLFMTIYKLFFKNCYSPGQIRIFTTIKRIIKGNINSQTMRTNDILISDSLVSYSRVINDLGLVFWNYWFDSNIGYNYKFESMILSIPSWIRIKQCWFEYKLTGQKQHLFNLIKYFTGLGPLLVNVLLKRMLLNATEEEKTNGELLLKLNHLNNWLYFALAINSTYSFIWDIKMDWHLELFDGLLVLIFPSRRKTSLTNYQFQILRNQLALPKLIYYIAIVADFILRYIWILKLFIINEELKKEKIKFIYIFSTFLFGYDAYSLGYALVETLEIFRRWIWCFIKLESDWVELYKDQDLSNQDIELETRLPKQG